MLSVSWVGIGVVLLCRTESYGAYENARMIHLVNLQPIGWFYSRTTIHTRLPETQKPVNRQVKWLFCWVKSQPSAGLPLFHISTCRLQCRGLRISHCALGRWLDTYTLPKFNIAHWKVTFWIGKQSSNHHFSGSMLNFGGVLYNIFNLMGRNLAYLLRWRHGPNLRIVLQLSDGIFCINSLYM